MYGNDTFFHLSAHGQIGLALISGGLGIITLWIYLHFSSRFGLFVKVLTAFMLLWAFSWLTPQIYYLYYWLIFGNLPMQWVLQVPDSPLNILQLAFFGGPATLSAHSKGILFWMMIVAGFFQHIRSKNGSSSGQTGS